VGSVVVAPDVAPADIAPLLAAGAVAVVTASGAPLSHAAILARSLGLPLVTGVGRELLGLPDGTVVLVDGDAGVVHVAPPSGLVDAAHGRARGAVARLEQARRRAAEPAVTLDGRAVPVLVNVGDAADARTAVAEGADGVGMLRTEFAFLHRSDGPSEQEQYLAYRGVADAIGDRPLVVRTLDLGADIPAWGGVVEPNPALGNRGLRFGLSAAGLLETQLRAIARLAAGRRLKVMFPMVTTVDELREARACLDWVMTGPAGTGTGATGVDVGITVEVPAAAVCADVFAPLVDFFAVGTNDPPSTRWLPTEATPRWPAWRTACTRPCWP
jgi:phosphoenolpyruvate-protein kinase (PTS system EI component)